MTISDVAAAAGVSRAAVSKVIRHAYGVSPGMRQRVEAAIAELGYRPSVAARALRGSSYRLGLEIPYVSGRFMTQIVDGANRAVAGTPYQLVLAPADGPEYNTLESLADGLVDGIIAVSPRVDPAWLEELARRVPIVMLGRHDNPEGYDTVVGDDAAGTGAVMDHLIGLGHRRIAHLTGPEAVVSADPVTPHVVRVAVYRDRLAAAGLDPIIEVARWEEGDTGVLDATARLLALPDPPTAIFAGHDDIAMIVLAGIAAAGRLGQVSVAGYDNTDIARHPLIDLTSVDQQGIEMGAQAATMLLERLRGRTERRQHVVATSLRVRGSTRPPVS